MKTRIVIETQRNGIEVFYPQVKLHWFLPWTDLFVLDESKIFSYNSEKDAVDALIKYKQTRDNLKNKEIIKTEIKQLDL